MIVHSNFLTNYGRKSTYLVSIFKAEIGPGQTLNLGQNSLYIGVDAPSLAKSFRLA